MSAERAGVTPPSCDALLARHQAQGWDEPGSGQDGEGGLLLAADLSGWAEEDAHDAVAAGRWPGQAAGAVDREVAGRAVAAFAHVSKVGRGSDSVCCG